MKYTAQKIDGGYNSAFRFLRLESLKVEPDYLGWPYEDEIALSPAAWNEKYCMPEGRLIFGLFDEEQLIGCCAVTTWDRDVTGQTALWNMVYLKPAYRGRGIATSLYMAREEHTRREYAEVVLCIRDGNERSRGIHVKNGAEYMESRTMDWNGKNPALWHWYRKGFQKAADALKVA